MSHIKAKILAGGFRELGAEKVTWLCEGGSNWLFEKIAQHILVRC